MADRKPYIATTQLFVGYALAHNPGDEVPADAVKANGWEDGVAHEGTKAAEHAAPSPADVTYPPPVPK